MIEIRKLKKDITFKKIFTLFIVLKILMIAIGIGSQLIPIEITNRQLRVDNIIVNPWAQYDAAAYVDIAENGYNQDFLDGRGNYAWYPFYPLLIKIFSFIGYWNSAFLISNITSLLAIAMMYLLLKEDLDKKQTLKTYFYILIFPTAYFFTAMYTESIFLLLSVSSFYFARKEKWMYAGIAGFLLSLTRPQGILIILPLIYMYFQKNKLNLQVLYLGLVPLGLITLLVYHFTLTGDPLIQFSTQSDFNRGIVLPWETIINSLNVLINSGDVKTLFYHSFNFFILGLFTFFVFSSYKILPKEYFIYSLALLIFPLFSFRLEAITRFYIVIFPAFMTMAIMSTKNKKIDLFLKFLYTIFFVLMILFALRHGNEEIFFSLPF